MRIVLGGTFDKLHKGHKALFQRAFELVGQGHIIVGLTSDVMAQMNRERMVRPYDERKLELQKYLKPLINGTPNTSYEIIEIDEVFNKAITQDIIADVLVLSEGRKLVGEQTNEHRKKHGKSELKLEVVPYVMAQDGLPIKATRVNNGEVDLDGNLLGTVKIAVGTNNDVKVRAVENVFNKVFESIDLVPLSVTSGVAEQPWDDDTIRGAKQRADNAIKQTPEAHFGVGIEAGLLWNDVGNKYLDVQYCAIQDRGGRVTMGHGSGFYYPNEVLEGVKAGRTVGQVMSEVTGIENIGKKQGAIGYLSKELLTREQLTEQAVLMAIVPRLTELYSL
jgi:inosine/xanthosine triphosphatase